MAVGHLVCVNTDRPDGCQAEHIPVHIGDTVRLRPFPGASLGLGGLLFGLALDLGSFI